jgi:uncharacterized protein (TIGR02246 family)
VSASSLLVQRQLDAYNAQDVEAMMACYADDAVLATFNGAVTHEGIEAVRQRHVDLFFQHPKNHARLVHRMDLGSVVIDHEDVERAPGGDRFQVAAIYTINGGKIVRVDFARAGAL